MKDNHVVLFPISLDELETRLVARFKAELITSAPTPPKGESEDFLTSKQVSKFLVVSLVTLAKWRKAGKIKYHRFGSRIRFRKSEILNVEKFGGRK